MILQFIHEQMAALDIRYEFGEWTSAVKYPYFVGEITEEPTTTESGLEEATMLLTGFHRGNFIDLATIKNIIKKHFDPIHGLRVSTADGSSIAAFFDGAFYIPTGEADLKKIQINLKIKQWKGA